MRALAFLVVLGSVAHAASDGASLYRERCALCHPTDSTSARGPGLGGVVGRRAGVLKFDYTQALRASKLVWTRATLDRFLTDPNAMVPSTNMPIPTPDAGERKAIITYLATLKRSAPAKVAPQVAAPENAAFGDWKTDAPGAQHHVTLGDLPAPFATTGARNPPQIAERGDRKPMAPPGYRVDLLVEHSPTRVMRVAPNGDVFTAETRDGTVHVLRGTSPVARTLWAAGLDGPFGMAFYPPGPSPKWLYVALGNSVVRYAYESGDLSPRGSPQTIVKELAPTRAGHTTRDIAFTPDGKRMLVSIGSSSNVADGLSDAPPGGIAAWETEHGVGAAWGDEAWRADVVSYDPEGHDRKPYATGLRNCVGLAIAPVTHEPWCATNERDMLGDDLVPDYVTHVQQGAFYGWPFYYMGDHEEPRLKDRRPDLRRKVTVPDVLVQPHSAALGIAFYDRKTFPLAMHGSAFVALHGSWNRSRRTGYKVVRVPMDDHGHATGSYVDFLTGFVVDDDHVWGRPVGIAVDKDGALLVSEDGNATIWRVVYVGPSG